MGVARLMGDVRLPGDANYATQPPHVGHSEPLKVAKTSNTSQNARASALRPLSNFSGREQQFLRLAPRAEAVFIARAAPAPFPPISARGPRRVPSRSSGASPAPWDAAGDRALALRSAWRCAPAV